LLKFIFNSLKNFLIILIWFLITYFIFILQPSQEFESYILSLKPENYIIHIETIKSDSSTELLHLHLTTDHDTSLSAYLKVPIDTLKYPSIIILGGMLTGKQAVNYAYGVNNVILAAPDYRYKTKYKYNLFKIAEDLLEAYNATYLQVVDNLLLIEYLQNWDKTKNKKISILGYSFGVPFAAATARIQHLDYLALVYGGAGLNFLIKHNLKLFSKSIDCFLSELFWLHLINFEPESNLQHAKPIPTLFINGKNDEKIPNISAKKLQRSILNEKTIIWIDSKHVHPANKKLSLEIINHLNSWYHKENFFN